MSQRITLTARARDSSRLLARHTVLDARLQEARDALGALPESPSCQALRGLTDFLASQMATLAEATKVPAA